jgi:hypothetical protein
MMDEELKLVLAAPNSELCIANLGFNLKFEKQTNIEVAAKTSTS